MTHTVKVVAVVNVVVIIIIVVVSSSGGAHSVSYPVGTKVSFAGGEVVMSKS
jgi:cytosine/uracil/thiamine/allantoin permease